MVFFPNHFAFIVDLLFDLLRLLTHNALSIPQKIPNPGADAVRMSVHIQFFDSSPDLADIRRLLIVQVVDQLGVGGIL
jgi:hypothetical protein